MTVNVSELVKDINKIDQLDITSEWSWLIEGSKRVVIVTKFGDLFLVGANDEINWLDTGTGKLTEVATSLGQFEEFLKDREKVLNWFMTELYLELQEQKVFLKENEVYSYEKLPILGGEYTIDNIKPTDISVHFAMSGQICEKLKDIPDGSKVNVKLAEENKKQWWKLW